MTREIFFFKNNADNEVGRLAPDLFLFFQKLYMRSKQVVSGLVSIYFDSLQLLMQ